MADIGLTCCSGIRGVCGGDGVRNRPTTLMRCPVTQVLYRRKPSVIQPSIKYQNKKMIVVYCMLYLYIRLNREKRLWCHITRQVEVTWLTTVFLHFILAHFAISIFSISRKLIQHTHTRLMALFPGLPGWAGTRKVNQSGFYWSKRQWVAVASARP